MAECSDDVEIERKGIQEGDAAQRTALVSLGPVSTVKTVRTYLRSGTVKAARTWTVQTADHDPRVKLILLLPPRMTSSVHIENCRTFCATLLAKGTP